MAWNDKQTTKNRHFGQAFRHALAGIVALVRHERNARADLVCGCCAIILGLIVHLSWQRWLVLGVTILIVFAAEAVNTAIERLADSLAGGRYMQGIGDAKDLAAGAVLLICLGALLVALWVFGPSLLQIGKQFI